MSEFASLFVLCAPALGIFHLKHHIYIQHGDWKNHECTRIHPCPQTSALHPMFMWFIDQFTDWLIDPPSDQWWVSSISKRLCTVLKLVLQPIKISPLRARCTCELFACDHQLLSEIFRILCWNCYTYVAASRLLLNDVCLSFLKLYFAQGCPCFPARYIKKNSHKGRNLFFLGELMSTALQGGISHFGEAGLSLYSLLPRI